MKKQIIAAILVILYIAYGCGNPEKNSTGNDILQTSDMNSKKIQPTSNSIELNNGVKWKVALEMIKYIRNMESEVNDFSITPKTILADFTQLATSLEIKIDSLTSNCTMDGKAHDELHKWLIQYIDTVNKLKQSKNKKQAIQNFEEIKSSFKNFNQYFE